MERPSFKVLLRDIGRMAERITKRSPYQNVCDTDTSRPLSDISNDDVFIQPSTGSYVEITDEKVGNFRPLHVGQE